MTAPGYLLLVVAGFVACAWGLSAAHRWPAPRNLLPALVVLGGMALMMAGWLLAAVPGFFRGGP